MVKKVFFLFLIFYPDNLFALSCRPPPTVYFAEFSDGQLKQAIKINNKSAGPMCRSRQVVESDPDDAVEKFILASQHYNIPIANGIYKLTITNRIFLSDPDYPKSMKLELYSTVSTFSMVKSEWQRVQLLEFLGSLFLNWGIASILFIFFIREVIVPNFKFHKIWSNPEEVRRHCIHALKRQNKFFIISFIISLALIFITSIPSLFGGIVLLTLLSILVIIGIVAYNSTRKKSS